MSSLFVKLPPRPPTPPRETHNEATTAQPNNVLTVASIDTHPSVHTPPGITSPSSAATHSTSRRRKKVGFSAKAEYKDPPIYPDGLTIRQNPTPVSLPRSASKPVKSILKVATYEPSPLESADGTSSDLPNLATMLESSIQMLAGGERHAKLDAYTMLPRALRASNNLPDRVALQDKMGLLTQFMQRDITLKTSDGNLDSSLVNHALTLLKTLLGFPAIASAINNDFGIFIIDHCIRSFEDPSIPKDIVRNLMQVIHMQNFSNKVMTTDRVGRLVTSLRHIEEHQQGKSIVMSRVLIYRKLVKQVRQLMVVHSDWLFDLFTDMLSTLKEIRSSAIALGFEAASSIGHEKQLSRKAMEIFKATLDDQRYIEYYKDKLDAMAEVKHESSAVPQIWSVVSLILRIRFNEWDYAQPWLNILEKCFNRPNLTTRIETNHAWNRLVYLMQSTGDGPLVKHLSYLTDPLKGQLKRKGPPDELRRAIFGSFCNLFYYTFKPNANTALLDTYWDASVKPMIAKLLDQNLEPSQEYLHFASAVLTGLFDCTVSRIWKADRINSNSPVKPEELAAIDSKWIRRNSSKVFATVEPVLERDFLALADHNSPGYRLWQSLVGNVASAASKEIKVSKDTVTFVTEAFGALQKIWRQGLPVDENAQPKAVQFLLAVRSFLEVMINSLGLFPFTEKPGKNQALLKAPMYQLFSMLSALPPGIPDDGDFAQFVVSVFAPFFASKNEKAKVDLAQDLLLTIPMDAPRPYGPWLLVAGNILTWLEHTSSSHPSSGSGNENPVGHEYRDIVKVLERGIKSTPNLPWVHWDPLFYALYERAREETGDAGVAIVAIEPLAKTVLDQLTQHGISTPSENTLKCITELLSVATHPRDKQAVDAARRRLWGTVFAGPRAAAFDPFDNLYKAVNEALSHLYQEFDSSNSAAAVDLLRELGGFYARCNRQLFLKTMIALQDGFLLWLHDPKRLLGSQNSAVFVEVKSLWEKLSSLLSETEKADLQLNILERLLCAAFGSSHRQIVNSSVALWNRLFENVENIDYPEKLKDALLQVRPLADDLILPGLDVSSAEYAGQQPSFMDESLDDYILPKMPYARSSRRGTPLPSLSNHSESPRSAKFGASTRRIDTTPKPKPTRASRRNTTPRLRHDDSQVQFAEINPSPLIDEAESQVLTERQKEVRERQKETTALFPEIRSSPGPKSKESTGAVQTRMSSPGQGHNPQVRLAVTPEPDGGYNDYVSSTPTPRRGQPIHIPDHDMMDPPSSPPEPRGNPLAAEIRSRSASNSLLDDWHFSSSPVSGSPNPSRQVNLPELPGQSEDIVMSDADDLPQSQYDAGEPSEDSPESVAENEVIEDSVIADKPKTLTIVTLDPIDPQTPQKGIKFAQRQETPKSDNDVFVDAPTSPLPSPLAPTPRRSERLTRSSVRSSLALVNEAPPPINNTSFDNISDLDEKSLLRLVVELDAARIDRSKYNRPSASPQKNQGTPGKTKASEALDCIVVGDSPTKRPTSSQGSQKLTSSQNNSQRPSSSQGSQRITRSASALSSVSATEEVQQIASSQSKGRGRGKRKRAVSKVSEASPKKQKQHQYSGSEQAEIPDSQPAAAVQVPSEAAEAVGGVTIPSSLPEFSSQESFNSGTGSRNSNESSQESSLPEHHHLADSDIEMTEDDQDVQSQIALESQQSQSQSQSLSQSQPEELEEESPAGDVTTAVAAVVDVEEPVQLNVHTAEQVEMAIPHEKDDINMAGEQQEKAVGDNNDNIINEKAAAAVAVVPVEEKQPSQQPQEAEQSQEDEQQQMSPVRKIMGMLRNGLDMLRSARLSRQEVYQIEDMFMDMKKELYEAESRGRMSAVREGEGSQGGEHKFIDC